MRKNRVLTNAIFCGAWYKARRVHVIVKAWRHENATETLDELLWKKENLFEIKTSASLRSRTIHKI